MDNNFINEHVAEIEDPNMIPEDADNGSDERPNAAIRISNLTHRFGHITALDDVSFQIPEGGIFGLLGPNGSGKSTLFRIMSTYLLPSSGSIRVGGSDIATDPALVRSKIAVVFQNPSVDEKLTVAENLRHHGYCYGLSGKGLQQSVREMVDRFGLSDRMNDRTETLSGGMRRKVEIAKGLLSGPEIMIMDEPTTGLDPRARREFWDLIAELHEQHNLTFVTTTHLLDEADRCQRVAILDKGHLVAEGTPAGLRDHVGGAVVEIQSEHINRIAQGLRDHFEITPKVMNHTLRFDAPEGYRLIPEIMDRLGENIQEITARKPTLEDVFIHLTGHKMEESVQNDQ